MCLFDSFKDTLYDSGPTLIQNAPIFIFTLSTFAKILFLNEVTICDSSGHELKGVTHHKRFKKMNFFKFVKKNRGKVEVWDTE